MLENSTAGTVIRYHPLLVALHWLMGLMVAASLFGGLALLATTPDSDPMKPIYLRAHMMGGLVLGALLLVRLATRLLTARPAPVGAGWQARAARIAHWAIYALLFATVMTGIGMAALGGLWPLLGGATEIPVSPDTLPPHAGHALFARLLIGLVVLHILAALRHSLAGQRIWGRMWFGQRRG
jgi:cytochrome b561